METAQYTYTDIQWLQAFGLGKTTALDYFATSPFFDRNCSNQVLRTQGIFDSPEQLAQMTGLEYILDQMRCVEPSLFVIRKQRRTGPREVQLLEVYYCLDGVIFQAAAMIDVLRARTAKASNQLLQSFQAYTQSMSSSESVENESPLSTEGGPRTGNVDGPELASLNNTLDRLASLI